MSLAEIVPAGLESLALTFNFLATGTARRGGGSVRSEVETCGK